MKSLREHFWLLIILVIAIILRVIALGNFPPGFSGDEAQQGYSAYSILKTGKDEWGEVLPLFPRGFGDFKPPIYTYLTIPSVAIFGLTIEAVRIPAAILGVFIVLTVYFLAKELFDRRVALWSTFILSILPWHIQISRTGFEGGAGILFFSLALLFYLKSLKSNKYLILSAISFGLTLYTYHSFKVFTIIFIVGLLIFFKDKLLNKRVVVAGIILLLFALPLILNIKTSLTRASDVGITSAQNLAGYFENKGISPIPYQLDRIMDNKVLYVSGKILENYLSYYSPQFFFTALRSDGSYLNFPGFPLLYPVEIILWLLAGYFLITKNNPSRKLVALWFFTATIPASLGQDMMSANRAAPLLPLVAIISGIGAAELASKRKNASLLLIVILTVSFLAFLRFYFIKLPQHPPESLRTNYQQIFKEVINLGDQYDEVVMSKAFTQPQIFIAFYGKVDPVFFQSFSKDWLRYEKSNKLYIDQLESWNLGNYRFEDINWGKKDSKRVNALIVAKAEDFPAEVTSILDLYDAKGKLLYRFVPTSP